MSNGVHARGRIRKGERFLEIGRFGPTASRSGASTTNRSNLTRRHRDVHRRLGAAGGGLAAAMIVLGVLVAFAAARRDIAAGRAQEALAFLIIPLGDILMFAALVGLALCYRARPDLHKRYMLLATLALLPAAIGRIPWFTDPSGFIPVFVLLLAAGPAYDFFSRGRPHPVLVYGGIAVFLSELGRFLSMQHPAWMAVATWLVG